MDPFLTVRVILIDAQGIFETHGIEIGPAEGSELTSNAAVCTNHPALD